MSRRSKSSRVTSTTSSASSASSTSVVNQKTTRELPSSYVGLNHGEIRSVFLDRNLSPLCDHAYLSQIDRKWRSLGKKISKRARI